MTINYPLFRDNAKNKGKTLKVIFKAKNCRDYDAKVLECKRNTKIVNVDTENEDYRLFSPYFVEKQVTIPEQIASFIKVPN